MAYVTKEIITKARAAIKALNKQYNVKATLSGVNTSSLKMRIASGDIDFIANYCENLTKCFQRVSSPDEAVAYVTKKGHLQVNHYYLDTAFSGAALEYLEAAKKILMADHWDKSDVMTDYFHCAFYLSIDIGGWNKPYVCTASKE